MPMFHRFLLLFNTPLARLGAGFALLVCGLFELANTVVEDYLGFQVRAHHGIIVFSVIHILGIIPQLVWGFGSVAEQLQKAPTEKKAGGLEQDVTK